MIIKVQDDNLKDKFLMEVSESPTVYNVFEKELVLIQDAGTKIFVCDAFGQLCPNYFWYIPASIKNHNHPPICRLRGGLVHHVKLAVGFADTLLDMLGIDDFDLRYSQTIAAVMLHDMLKRGAVEDELDTFPDHGTATRSHGRYCAEQISTHMHIDSKIERVIRAVKLHMGRWTQDVTPHELGVLRIDEVARTTHLADYLASRALHSFLGERVMDKSMRYLESE